MLDFIMSLLAMQYYELAYAFSNFRLVVIRSQILNRTQWMTKCHDPNLKASLAYGTCYGFYSEPRSIHSCPSVDAFETAEWRRPTQM